MSRNIERAIEYRQEGKHQEANEMFVKLVIENPYDASVHYQCAWSFDVLGKESEAVPLYEKAIELGLPSSELEGALLGLGSTYRTLGKYEKSKGVFLKGLEQFPNNRAIQVFYAMTLYNLGENGKAMEYLLTNLVETTSDESILSYRKAIEFYSDKLDEVWE
ncbi:tetratricopeptide repeat protein [Guptibacillus algicola]|uniref:tetratricopeptide repeat protein n=1 Tax=Guptibacillus algicola TaxID=225844 RepID=UPI001CD4CE3E|nr:tetratricopeptide repeat protein [Alkalihalobacillus algicola]MCA0988563.1 tetratricopeptide repeat protein [Alkalihalobacillus algicola]